MELTNVKPSEVSFEKTLHRSSVSVVFLVTIRGVSCAMKVIHSAFSRSEETYWLDIERCPFKCESIAYRRLKESGLCARGIVPQVYGTMERLNPDDYAPHLHNFQEDLDLPNAILLEYITGWENLCRANYSKARMNKFIEHIKAIHNARIFHYDAHPRNMMVFPDAKEEDKVMWIDFSRSQTEPVHQSPRFNYFIENEMEVVLEIGQAMENDIAKGDERVYDLAPFYGVPRGAKVAVPPDVDFKI